MKTIAVILNLMLFGLFVLLTAKNGRPVDLQGWLLLTLMFSAPLSSLIMFFKSEKYSRSNPHSKENRLEKVEDDLDILGDEEVQDDAEELSEEDAEDIYDLSEEKKKIGSLLGED